MLFLPIESFNFWCVYVFFRIRDSEHAVHEGVDIQFVVRRIDRKWFYGMKLVPEVTKTLTTLKKLKERKCSRRCKFVILFHVFPPHISAREISDVDNDDSWVSKSF